MAEVESVESAQLDILKPVWNHTAEQTAPAAGTVLCTHTVAAGKKGYIFGFFISAQEANNFLINWTSGGAAKSKRIVVSGPGSYESVDNVAMNNDLLADAGTAITITNVNDGRVGIVYQADILVGEV